MSGGDVRVDPSRPDPDLIDDSQELEDCVLQELEEFISGDEMDPHHDESGLGVRMDQERWWSLLVQAVGGRDRLPKA
ncbi:hypothetical protein MK280_10725 [Myxococcota bacterium]|nr:hypothetical protein [Myxococcota bacterium]